MDHHKYVISFYTRQIRVTKAVRNGGFSGIADMYNHEKASHYFQLEYAVTPVVLKAFKDHLDGMLHM